MKVAIQIDQLGFAVPGGIGTYVRQLLATMPGEDLGLELVAFHAPFSQEPDVAIGRAVLLRTPIKFLYPAWTYLGLPPLPRALNSAGLVHVTNPVGIPRTGIKLVVTVHDLAFERFPESFPLRWLRLYRAGLRAAERRADAIITPSRATAHDLIARGNVDASKVYVTPLASSLVAASDDPATAVERLGVAAPFILCAATLEPRKNQLRLVQAYRRIAERLPHQLVLAGPTGWLSERLETEIAQGGPGKIVRVGRLGDADLDALYRSASVVSYPSLYEGFGLPVIEAMARGVPVVASTTPAVAETAGDAALLIEPTDVDALAGALERVLTDEGLAADLRSRGLARAAGFSWEATARATLEVYRKVIGAS